MAKFFNKNPTADHIMMFDFTASAKCLVRHWRFPVTGRNELGTQLLRCTRCILFGLVDRQLR
jgi:hypothetical protein